MKQSTVYLLEVNNAGLWSGVEVYRDEDAAGGAWRSKTIESVREEKGDDAPADLDSLSDEELEDVADPLSPQGTGFYCVERIDFYE